MISNMVRPFLNQLGKPKEIADQVSLMSGEALNAKAVCQWGYDGKVPHRWCPFIAKLAKKKRVKNVPPELKVHMQ